jgi:superfamily II DNA/RNA helicase
MSESVVNNNETNSVEIHETENIYTVEKWDELKISENLLRGIYSYGFENPSEIQKKSIAPIIAGRDIIAQAQSGMGKTGAFSIGTLQRIDVSQPVIQAVLLAPTHELVKQTQKVIQALGSQIPGLKVKTLIGGTSIQDDAKDIRDNCPHIIVGSAGRVYDMFRRRYINGRFIKIMILDEADVMLSTGFKEQIYNLFQHFPEEIQVAIFSATLPPDILLLTEKFMRNPVKITMAAEKLNLECITQYYIALRHDNDKFDVLKDLFSYISLSQCIIYCNSVRRVSDLYAAMIADGFSVCCIHSSMDRVERDREFQEFRSGKYRVLISSNVTARGIDIQQVSTVINFDIPKDEHTYLHRIGRSGRWGRKGMAINFVTKFDIQNMKRIEEYYKINIQELPANFSGDPMDT